MLEEDSRLLPDFDHLFCGFFRRFHVLCVTPAETAVTECKHLVRKRLNNVHTMGILSRISVNANPPLQRIVVLEINERAMSIPSAPPIQRLCIVHKIPPEDALHFFGLLKHSLAEGSEKLAEISPHNSHCVDVQQIKVSNVSMSSARAGLTSVPIVPIDTEISAIEQLVNSREPSLERVFPVHNGALELRPINGAVSSRKEALEHELEASILGREIRLKLDSKRLAVSFRLPGPVVVFRIVGLQPSNMILAEKSSAASASLDSHAVHSKVTAIRALANWIPIVSHDKTSRAFALYNIIFAALPLRICKRIPACAYSVLCWPCTKNLHFCTFCLYSSFLKMIKTQRNQRFLCTLHKNNGKILSIFLS